MTTSAQTSLFDRIGGMAAVNAAVDIFYKKVLADETVNYYFTHIDIQKQAGKLRGFLAFAFGAPMNYSGKSMRDAHGHMRISNAQFNAVAGHLVTTLRELGVAENLIDEVVNIAESVRGDIVVHH